MLRHRLSIFLALVLLLPCSSEALADLRAGAAKVEITPPLGVSLDGPISKPGPATSIHDPLHARALVLESAGVRLAIVVCDACMIDQDVFDAAKEQLQRHDNWPPSMLLMSATHTHAAPRLNHISRLPADDAYHQQVAGLIAQAVQEASGNLRPAEIGFASFERPDLLACRRKLCEPGAAGPNPFGETGESISSVAGRAASTVEPAGPVDPQFSILAVRHRDGQPLCLLGNFSVHYCGGYQSGAVSADYFGYFCQAIETQLGGSERHHPVVGIMSNGTSGNTGAFQGSPRKFKPFEGMQFHGRALAEEALQAIEGIDYRSDLTLQMLETELELGVRRPDAARLQWAETLLAEPPAKLPHRWSRIYAQETVHLSSYPATRKIKLQALRIGDIAITACPCEVFAETGLDIKRHSPFPNTFTIELANGYGGYLPPRKQHELGGYESWAARSSYLEIDAEQKIREQLLGLLQQLK
ncbi:MAG: neutral/alkaline non-lysosomal ceramidase N-terminal domain-containing protein [Planctomycetales bacterium]|nr:neutral/alkaline non-lysosomal ceramidase N-terminal domain-containing protein [Planctomycetales bacterium]